MKKYNGKELYKGLLFIKSMMSMNNVNRQKELDQTYALRVGIECEQTVVDDGASTSVDRPQMRQLMEILETFRMHRKIFKKQSIHDDLMKMREKWLNASIYHNPQFLTCRFPMADLPLVQT